MTLKLPINQLVESVSEEPQTERVLRYLGESVITIDLFGKSTKPSLQSVEEFNNALETGRLRLIEYDPFAAKNLPEEDIPVKHREIRDQAWLLVSDILSASGDAIFSEKGRWSLISGIAARHNRSAKNGYQLLLRFWRGGQIKNALLPNYAITQTEFNGGRKGDFKITSDVTRRFELGVKKFYERIEKPSLSEAYRKTIAAYFNLGYRIERGVQTPVIPPADEIPSMRQFRYWFKGNRNPEKTLRSREGKNFDLKHRDLPGDSTSMSFGPGSIYQIDSTSGDIYLVSSINPSLIVGRPTLYLVTDVFTRCIAGFQLSLENASYAEACIAIENSISDKVEFCRKHDFEIEPEEWPCIGVPECIVADRGELQGKMADSITSGLGIRLDNTAPYRADMKGIVERYFRLNNQRLFHKLPGAVRKSKERGDKDPRLEATLNIHQLTRLVIAFILDHNNRILKSYPFDSFQVAADLDPIPMKLWEWGVEARNGHLRIAPQDVVKTHLLPAAQAGVTARGIHFRKAYYTCQTAIEEQWFLRARNGKPRKVQVSYDPRDSSILYLRSGNTLEKCYIKESSQNLRDRTWDEIQAYYLELAKKNKSRHADELQRAAVLDSQIEFAVKEATDTVKKTPKPSTKKARLEGIRENRKEEAKRERTSSISEEKPEAPPGAYTDYVPPASHINALRKAKSPRR